MHLLVKPYHSFLQLEPSEPDHLLAVYLSPLLRSGDLLAGINDHVGRTPFQFLKPPYKMLSILQRRLTNDILLLRRSCENLQSNNIPCSTTISYSVRAKFDFFVNTSPSWFEIFLKNVVNPDTLLRFSGLGSVDSSTHRSGAKPHVKTRKSICNTNNGVRVYFYLICILTWN